MGPPAVKRFWRGASVVEQGEAFAVELDGRPVKTPARVPLAVPTRALADAIAAEWDAQGDTVNPRAMTLTGLANAAIDHAAPDPTMFAAGLAKFGESDLLYYCAEHPRRLAERQASAWDPLLDWARRRFNVDFALGSGVMPVAQPQATVRALALAVAAYDPFRLAALSPLVTVGGSLIAALAVAEGAIAPDAAWDAVTIDEHFQLEEWGSDGEAEKALAARHEDFDAGARLLGLLS